VVSLPTPVGGSCAQHAFRRLASGFTRDLEPSRAGKRRVGDADSKHVVLDDAARSAVLTAGVVDGIATPWVAEKELVAFEFLRAALRRASLHGVGLHATGEWCVVPSSCLALHFFHWSCWHCWSCSHVITVP